MKYHRLLFSIMLISVLAFTASLSCAGILIITNSSVHDASLDKNEIKDIFLGKKTKWDDNTKIRFATMEDSPLHQLFLKHYVDKTASQFRNYWKHQTFTGKGFAPKSFKTDAQMIKFVAETEGAVGYIDTRSITALNGYSSHIKKINHDSGETINLGFLSNNGN